MNEFLKNGDFSTELRCDIISQENPKHAGSNGWNVDFPSLFFVHNLQIYLLLILM